MPIEKLDHLSLLKITGSDTDSFLQGQLTNDINLVNGNWQYSGYCNPKGRLIALFQLWKIDGEVFALIDKSLVENTVKRLRMYVMRSKVDISIEDIDIFSANDLQSLIAITSITNNAPEQNQIIETNEGIILCAEEHFLFLNRSANIAETDIVKSKANWLSTNISKGIPHLDIHSTELFIPQMLNLDVLNGINFKKGCYTGQEIIARMHYLGKLKQRMFVCDVDSGSSIQTGDKVYSDKELTKSVGNIVSAHQKKALTVLRLDSIDTTLHMNNGAVLNVSESQPYSLETNKGA